MCVPTLLLTHVRVRIFGPETPKFGQKLGFFAKYWHFMSISSHARPKKHCKTRCLDGISVMWVPTILLSTLKIRIFAQNRPDLAQNWHFGTFWARPFRLIWCLVGGLVGGCGARAVSRKTLIYFILVVNDTQSDSIQYLNFAKK